MEARSGRRQPGLAGGARWAVAALLAVIAACLLMEAAVGPSPARGQEPAGAADHIIVSTGKVTAESYGLYIVDLKNGTIAVYQYLTSQRKLRLMAVRNFLFDVQLDEYNTEPAPREIRKLVQQQKRLVETK